MASGSGQGILASSFFVEGNYITSSDIDNWDGETYAEKLAAIQRAEQLIEFVTKDYFYEKDEVLKLDGNGKDRIFTGLSAKLLSITSITSFGVTVPSDVYDFDDYSIYIDPTLLVEEPIIAVDYYHIFPKGKNNIEITCTVGHTSCPAAIKQAAIILVRAENDSTLYSRYNMNESESFEGHSWKRPGRFLTGILEADRLLNSYIVRVPILWAV